MADSDQEIRIKYSVDANEVFNAFEELESASRQVQTELLKSANTLETSYKKAGEAMIKAKEEAQELALELEKTSQKTAKSLTSFADIKTEKSFEKEQAKELSEMRRNQTKELQDYKVAVRKSVSELTEMEKAYARTQQSLAKEVNKTRTAELKKRVQVEKTSIKQTQAAHREYVKVTQQGFGVMSAQARAYGKTIQNLKNQIVTTAKQSGQSWQQVAQGMQKAGVPAQQINQALKELNTTTKQTQGGLRGLINNFKSLGGVAATIGTIVGVSLVQAFRNVVDLAGDVINRGKEMQEVFFVLEVAIRGLQRAGVDTTIASWNKQLIALKKQFPIFTKREFAESASLAALMTREFGFTEDQIAGVVQQAALLAELTGRDLLESVRGITFAIGSGYFESLQRAGINISRAVVANEALAQGYEGVYNELEPVIRASVTYSVIQNNLSALQDDAGRKIETFAGRILNLKRAWNELLDTLGEITSRSETLSDALEDVTKVLDSVRNILDSLSRLGVDPIEILINLLKGGIIGDGVKELERLDAVLSTVVTLAENLNRILGEGELQVSAFGQEFTLTFGKVENLFGDIIGEAEKLRDVMFGGVMFSPEEFQKVIDATKALDKDINEIDEEAKQRNVEIWSDWSQDRTEIWENHLERMADLETDLTNRLAEIDIKAQQKIDDEIASNAFNVAEAIRRAAFRREDAERKFRERELKSERRFQEKMRQLRENFLLNLEDAVRERDARQIIRLTRQFNLRRTQMIREEKLNKDDRQAQFQEELRQIEQQKQERLRQLAIEHQRRLDAIARQAERERAQAQLDFERRKADEAARVIAEQEERNKRRDDQLKDLADDLQERYDELLSALQDEFNLTKTQTEAVAGLYKSAYGRGGLIDNSLVEYQQRLLQTEALVRRLNLFIGQMTPLPSLTGANNIEDAGGQAEGGTIIARKPTVALFGEAGPEMATFTPLNKLGSQDSAKVTPLDASNMPRDGRIKLEMLLSPDLEARIVDNTLGEIADVNFAIERAKK